LTPVSAGKSKKIRDAVKCLLSEWVKMYELRPSFSREIRINSAFIPCILFKPKILIVFDIVKMEINDTQ
jgi:hypothetical protein